MVKFAAGEMGCSRVIWNGGLEPADQERLIIGISDVALMATCDGMSGEVELRHQCRLVDTRVGGLVAAVNAERIAGFPSGRLFLDSIEQALAVALVNGYAVQPFCADAPRRTRSRTLANETALSNKVRAALISCDRLVGIQGSWCKTTRPTIPSLVVLGHRSEKRVFRPSGSLPLGRNV